MGGSEGAAIERRLALSYAPPAARVALDTLWAIDAALGEVVAGNGPAALRQIKLVWWRDALAALDQAAPPAQPLLEAAARLPLSGGDLAALEEPWAVLLSEDPLSGDDLGDHARRGRILFALGARLLGEEAAEAVLRAGEAWALADLARRSSDAAEADAARLLAGARVDPGYRWPRRLRPLGMLAAVAPSPEPPGSPRRILRMLRHRLTGR